MRDYNPDWHRLLADVATNQITYEPSGVVWTYKRAGKPVPREDALMLAGMGRNGLLADRDLRGVELSSVGKVRLAEWDKKATSRG